MSRNVRSSNSAKAVTACLISRSNSRPRTLYRLATPLADSDGFNMRRSRKLLVGRVFAVLDLRVESGRRVCAARRDRQPREYMNKPSHSQLHIDAAGEAARRQAANEGGDWRIGTMRFPVN
jgi:hypothetical protein